jgi:hypothetical protein
MGALPVFELRSNLTTYHGKALACYETLQIGVNSLILGGVGNENYGWQQSTRYKCVLF